MNRLHRVKTVFSQVVDAPAEKRAGLLDSLCGTDAELRAEVTALLREASHDAVERVVEDAAKDALGGGVDSNTRRAFGVWRLKKLLARGGMGSVYLAERADGEFEQQAAIKLINPAMLSPEALRRFNDERQILAKLKHPNIASLIDGGTTADGDPWLAMEFVDGVRIDDYCNDEALGLEARLALFRKVCAAIDYAHRNLVVHRDIKPANILVDGNGEPQLLDFGVAKLFGDADVEPTVTVTEMRALTPRYASPEQLKGESLTIATDVYSLSVLLHELLTGLSPFDKQTGDAVALHHAICEGDREPPSVISGRQRPPVVRQVPARELAGDLDNIVLKGLRAEPDRRYASARELGDDLQRFLRHEPVRARPDTWQYRSAKFLKRRRGGVIAATLVVVLVASMSALFVERIISERDVARAERERAEQVTNFLTDLLQGADRHESAGEEVTVRNLLDDGAQRIRTELEGQPVERARLMQTIADTYNSLSLHEPSTELSREAHALRENALGPNHYETLESARNVAFSSMLSGGDIDESIAALIDVRDRQIEHLGADSDRVAATRNGLGIAYRNKGEFSNALAEFEEAYRIVSDLPPVHDDYIFQPNLLNQIGIAYDKLGDFDASRKAYEQAADWYVERGLNDHPLVGSLYNNIGLNFRRQGQLDEAVIYLEQAVQHTLRVQGEDNEDFEIQASTLGGILGQLGQFDRSSEYLTKARDVAETLYGRDHPYYAWHLTNIGRVLQLEGRHGEAIRLFRDAASVHRKAYGDYHPFLAAAEVNLAESLIATGDAAAGEKLIAKTLETMHAQSEFEKDVEALGRAVHGHALARLGRHNEAKPVILAGLRDLRAHLGDEHQMTAKAALFTIELLEFEGSETDHLLPLTAPLDGLYRPF